MPYFRNKKLDFNEEVSINKRATRITLNSPLSVLARPKGMRYYNFWLKALNISKSGMLVETPKETIMPFKEGSVLSTTVDMGLDFFERPIHIDFKICRIVTKGDHFQYGLEIIHMNPTSQHIFAQMLR